MLDSRGGPHCVLLGSSLWGSLQSTGQASQPAVTPTPHRQSQLSSCPYIVVILPSPGPNTNTSFFHCRHLSDGDQERGACACACARACCPLHPVASPPIRTVSLGVFLIGGSQNETRPPRISPFRRGKREAPDICPRIVACPDAPVPPRRPTQILTNRWACACIRRPSTNPHPQNPLDGITSLSSSPEKVSDSSREIRIVAAPAHLLPPQKLAVSSTAQQKDHPACRLACRLACRPACPAAALCYFLRSQRPRGLPGTFHAKGPSTGYPGKNGLLAHPLPFRPFCFVLSTTYLSVHQSFFPSTLVIPWGQPPWAKQKTTSFLFTAVLALGELEFIISSSVEVTCQPLRSLSSSTTVSRP